MQTNNKLREALINIAASVRDESEDTELPCVAYGIARRVRRMAEAALAAPERNCDKGTADEQLERFIKKWESVGYGEIDERSIHMMSIFSRWAQLRYGSEVSDESK